jgi:uncharacterized protein YeaO (DUF488 family)
MRSKLYTWESPVWVIIFIIFLVGVNVLLFHSYQQSYLLKKLPEPQFWDYVGSDQFKTVNVSLMIPIILAAVGGIFKIGASVEERIRSARQQLTEKRLECIKQTSELWNILYNLANDVRFFKKGIDYKQHIVDILTKLENLDNMGEEIISLWRSRFPNLSPEAITSFIQFLNIPWDSTVTVSYCILDKNMDEKDISELQDSLGIIKDVIKFLAHENILFVLNDSVELLGTDLSGEDKKKKEAQIKSRLAMLNNWTKAIEKEKEENNQILSTVQGEQVDSFREAAKKLKKWLRENPEKTDYPDYQDFYDLFDKIPLNYPHAFEIDYSKEYVNYIARWLGCQFMYYHVQQRAKESDQINIKRVYEPPDNLDGTRILVDRWWPLRLWPKYLFKGKAKIDLWVKDLAPSNKLMKWYSNDPSKWEEFKTRYFAKLDGQKAEVNKLALKIGKDQITFLYGSKEENLNNAQALKIYMEKRL